MQRSANINIEGIPQMPYHLLMENLTMAKDQDMTTCQGLTKMVIVNHHPITATTTIAVREVEVLKPKDMQTSC